MIDIVDSTGGELRMLDSDVPRAKNICNVQIGGLEYEKTFGIDIEYFLQEGLQFQNSSFQSYIVQRLSEYGVNVTSVVSVIDRLFETLSFNIGNPSTGDGLVGG